MSHTPGDHVDQQRQIATYLHYGYLPVLLREVATRPWAGFRRDPTLSRTPSSEKLRMGIEAFRAGFGEVERGDHVVPLSGGLDSRAILAELRERVEAQRIRTVTVGVPGSFDYEIPVAVARAAGVRHERIDLTREPLTRAAMLRVAEREGRRTWASTTAYNRLMRERMGADAIYWTGYLGGTFTSDSAIPPDGDISWEEAVRRYAARHRRVPMPGFTAPGFDAAAVLPQAPIFRESELSPTEQLYLALRQECMTGPVNLPEGFEHRVPFRSEAWVHFALHLSAEERRQQRFYRQMLYTAYPRLFSLPTRNTGGLPLFPTRWQRAVGRARRALRRLPLGRGSVNPYANYIDFAAAIRTRPDVMRLVRDAISVLDDTQVVPWIDLNGLLAQHMAGTADHSRALILLSALEIHLSVARTSGSASLEMVEL
jgi:hypothetical protein